MNVVEIWSHTEEAIANEADSFAGMLERLRNYISPALIGNGAWEKVQARTRELPVTMAAFPFGFELPLHDPRPVADFGVSLRGGSRTARFFDEAKRSGSKNPTVARIVRLVAETDDADSTLRRVVDRKMLLEFDVHSAPDGEQPEPGFFLYPEERVLVMDGSTDGLWGLGVVVDAVEAAMGWDVDAAGRRHIKDLFLAMPPDACVRAVGAFPAWDRGIRLAVTGLRKTKDLTAFLERAGWTGQTSTIASIASPLEEKGAYAYMGLHFDVNATGIGPKLGLSFYAQEGQWLKDIRHWMGIIDGIRELGLVVPEKLSELVKTWSGVTTLLGQGAQLVLIRGLHHIKVVVSGERVEQVKAYPFLLLMDGRPLASSPRP